MRRRLLGGVFFVLVLAWGLLSGGCAYGPWTRTDLPPIVFVHGEGDSAALWQTTLWRFESNGWPRDRLVALQQPYPLARDDDAKAQPGRSSSAEHMAFLKAEVERVLARTGAKQVVLVGNGRGGVAIRNYIQNGGGDKTVSHAILAGTPNHGVWAIPGYREGSEFSGTGPFLKALNAPKNEAGDEVSGPVQWLTLRSDNNDRLAQPEGDWKGLKDKASNVGFEGPELKGAQNMVLTRADQRETATSSAAFEASYRFITGQAPAVLQIWPEYRVLLDGQVTGMGVNSADRASTDSNFSNNLAVPKARVEVYAVDSHSGLRLGAALHAREVDANGRWGPFLGQSGVAYEFVVRAPGYAITHIYRSSFARGSNYVNLKADRIADADLPAFSIIQLTRPRGLLDPTTAYVKFDELSPPPGITIARFATMDSSKITLAKPQNRAISAERHTDRIERVVGRTWPAKESHVMWLEFTQ